MEENFRIRCYFKQMKNKPLVTIIIPAYNTGKYLEDCLSSVCKQTYKNIEIIVVNDGSSDNSGEIIDNYSRRHTNISVVTNKKPSGSGEVASNGGIKLAKGKYIAIMDSDDISLPNRIEKEVDFLEKHLDYFLVSTSAEVIDENGLRINFLDVGMGYKSLFKKMYLSNSIINSSVMFRRFEIDNEFYKIKYPFYNDYYSWFFYLDKGKKFHTLKDRLVKYRISLSSSTRKNLKRNFKISFLIKKDFLKSKRFKLSVFDKAIVLLQELVITLLPANLIDFLSEWNAERQRAK